MLVPMAEYLLDWTETDTSIFYSAAGVEVRNCVANRDNLGPSPNFRVTTISVFLLTDHCSNCGGRYSEQMGWRQVITVVTLQ